MYLCLILLIIHYEIFFNVMEESELHEEKFSTVPKHNNLKLHLPEKNFETSFS